ncbi:MAG: hypothetical protein JKY00_02590 [Roseicyclus sp.]|nr:hypothetical protein [Roseicyclus sp.]
MSIAFNTQFSRLAPAIAVGLSLCAADAAAQGTNTTDIGQLAAADQGTNLAFPAIFGSASAVAPVGGTGYVALTYATPRNGISGSDADGDVVAGYTFGNPVDAISVSVGVAITGIDPFGDSGSFNISASRLLGSTDRSATFIGVSALGLGGWGDASLDGESYNVYVSHLTSLGAGSAEIPLQITFGYGTRATLSDEGTGRVTDGIFYGIGMGVTHSLSLSASGTATQLNVGAVLSIPQIEGLSLAAGIFDVTDNTDRQQVTATIAYAF